MYYHTFVMAQLGLIRTNFYLSVYLPLYSALQPWGNIQQVVLQLFLSFTQLHGEMRNVGFFVFFNEKTNFLEIYVWGRGKAFFAKSFFVVQCHYLTEVRNLLYSE